jgi:hypothetical protein
LSELEDPVATLLRLINTRIRVTKDDGSLARILASEAALDRELLLKEYERKLLFYRSRFGRSGQEIEPDWKPQTANIHFGCNTRDR